MRRKLKGVLSAFGILVALALGIFAAVKIGKLEKTKELGATSYSIGSIDEKGAEIESDYALRTGFLEADKFNSIKLCDEPEITYKLFYYGADKKYLSSVVGVSDLNEIAETVTENELTKTVKYFRVVIRVPEAKDKVTLFNNGFVQSLSITIPFGNTLAPKSYEDTPYYFLIVVKKAFFYTAENYGAVGPVASEPPSISELEKESSDYNVSVESSIEAITSNYYTCNPKEEAEYYLRNGDLLNYKKSVLPGLWYAYSGNVVTDSDVVPITVNYQKWDSDTDNAFLKNATKTINVPKYYCLSKKIVNSEIYDACTNGWSDFNVTVTEKIKQISGSGEVYQDGETFTYRSGKGLKSHSLTENGGSVTVDYGTFAPENVLLQCCFVIKLYSQSYPSGNTTEVKLFLRGTVLGRSVEFKRDSIAAYLNNQFSCLGSINMSCVKVKSLGVVTATIGSDKLVLRGDSEELASCRCYLSVSLEDDTQRPCVINYIRFTLDSDGNIQETAVQETLKGSLWRSVFYRINKSALINNSYGFIQSVVDNVLNSGNVKLSDGSLIGYATVSDITREYASANSSQFVLNVKYSKNTFFRFIEDFGTSTSERYLKVPSNKGEYASFLLKEYITDVDGYSVCGIKSADETLATLTEAAAKTDFNNYKINVKCKLNEGKIIPIIIEYGEYINLKLSYFADIVFDGKPSGFAYQKTIFVKASQKLFKKNDFSGYSQRAITSEEFQGVLDKLDVKDRYTYYCENSDDIAELILDEEGVLCITPNYLPWSIVDDENKVLAEVGITCLSDWKTLFSNYGLTQDIKLMDDIYYSPTEVYGYFYVVGLNMDVFDSDTLFADNTALSSSTALVGRCAVGKCDIAVPYDILKNRSNGAAVTGVWKNNDNSGYKYSLKGEKPEWTSSYVTYLCYLDGTKTSGECSVSDNVEFADEAASDDKPGGESGGSDSADASDASDDDSSSGGSYSSGGDSTSSDNSSDLFEDFMKEFDFKKVAAIAGGCLGIVAVIMIVLYAAPQVVKGVKGTQNDDYLGDSNEEE